MNTHHPVQFQILHRFLRHGGNHLAQILAGGIAKGNVPHNAIAEKRVVQRPFRPVKILVGENNVTGANPLAEAAHRTDGHHPVHAKLLEAPDVRLVVDLGGEDPVTTPVPGQEVNLRTTQSTMNISVRGFPERSVEGDLADRFEPFKLIQTTAADDA